MVTDATTLAEQQRTLEAGRAALDNERRVWQQQRDEAEEAAVRDNPDAFAALRQKRDLDRKAALLQRKEEEIAAKETRTQTQAEALTARTREELANRIASELGVDAAALTKFTDGSEAAMKELAAQLPKKSIVPAASKPDSGRSAGGSPTRAQIMDAYLQNPNDETRRAYEAIRG